MLTVLRQRNFTFLLVGQLVSSIGDWVLLIAFPFYIYEQTGSAWAAGGMLIALNVPGLLLGPVAGVLADRWDRRRTMIAADVLRAVVLLPLLIVPATGWMWLFYVVAFVEACISQFFYPARGALMPNLVREEDLLAANSVSGVSDNVVRLIGPPLAGMLMTYLGVAHVVLVDVFSYLASGTLIFLVALPTRTAPAAVRAAESTLAKWASVWREWVAGLRYVIQDQLIGVVFGIQALMLLSNGLRSTLYVAFVKDILGAGAFQFGWLAGAQGVGSIVGGFIMGHVGKRVRPKTWMALGLLMIGAGSLVEVNFPSMTLSLSMALVLGVPIMGYFISFGTLIQTKVPDDYRGRVFGTLGAVQALMAITGAVAAGFLGDRVGIVPILNGSAVIWLAAGLLALIGMRAAMVEMPKAAPAVVEGT